MRKKNKILIFSIIMGSLIALIGMGIFLKIKYKHNVTDNISTLSSIQYQSIDGSLKRLVFSDKFNVIFFFNSECEHCQQEARLISANTSRFTNSEIYFFSTEELPAIAKFVDDVGFGKNSPVKVGHVEYQQVAYPMGVNTYPMCFIYSPDGKLLKRYAGEVKIDAIVKYL